MIYGSFWPCSQVQHRRALQAGKHRPIYPPLPNSLRDMQSRSGVPRNRLRSWPPWHDDSMVIVTIVSSSMPTVQTSQTFSFKYLYCFRVQLQWTQLINTTYGSKHIEVMNFSRLLVRRCRICIQVISNTYWGKHAILLYFYHLEC